MNDNYFDKKIREILQRPPEFEPSPAARKDLLRRLDALGRNRRRPPVGWWWLLFPAGILLGWWLAQLGTPRSQTMTAHAHQRDTIVVEKWHTRRDTIVLIQRLETATPPPPNPINQIDELLAPFNPIVSTWKQSNLSGAGGPTDRLPLTSGGTAMGYLPPLSLAAKDARKPASLRRTYAAAPAIERLALQPVDPLRRRDPLLDDDRILLPPLLDHAPTLPLWVHFVPTGLGAAIEGGPAFFAAMGVEDMKGTSWRLHARLHFAGHAFLQTGIGLTTQMFKIEDEELLATFPQIEPENPGDKLHDIYAEDLRFLELPLVLGWQGQWGQWQPMIGLGITARQPIRQHLRYEFIDATGEYYIPVSFDQHALDLHTWSVHLGMGRHLWRGLSANVALRFEKDWKKGANDLIRLQYLAPSLRLGWQF